MCRSSDQVSETKLEMAERHVREGAERIVRQNGLIETLIRDGHDKMLLQAHSLLVEFEAIQAMSENHLARYRAEAAEAS